MRSVAVGYCHPGWVEEEFLFSLHACFATDTGKVLHPDLIRVGGGPRLHTLRDRMVRVFLEMPCEWLWCVDTDMVWPPDALAAVLAAAHWRDTPIVGGLCFGTGRSGGAVFPTIFDFDGDHDTYRTRPDYARGELVACDGTGFAFVVVHRSVFEAIAEKHGVLDDGTVDPQPWFPDGPVGGGHLLEGDLQFCRRARHLGFPVHVHTGARVGHKKSIVVDEAFFDHVAATQAELGRP